MTKRDLRFLQIDRLLSEESLNQDPEMILMKKERRVALFRILPAFFRDRQINQICDRFGFYEGNKDYSHVDLKKLDLALKSFNLLQPDKSLQLYLKKRRFGVESGACINTNYFDSI